MHRVHIIRPVWSIVVFVTVVLISRAVRLDRLGAGDLFAVGVKSAQLVEVRVEALKRLAETLVVVDVSRNSVTPPSGQLVESDGWAVR